MHVTVTARHVEIPPLLEEMLRSKIEKLDHFGHKILSAHAIFGRERYYYTSEITLSTKGLQFVGKAKERRDFLTSLESALMKLKEQLRRHESKQVETRRRAARRGKKLNLPSGEPLMPLDEVAG